MIAALKLGDITNNSCKKRPTNMDALRHRATGFIQIEKLSEFHDKVRGNQKKSDSHKEKLKFVKEKDFKRQPQQPKYETYTLLTESRARILEKAFHKEILGCIPIARPTAPNNAYIIETLVILQKKCIVLKDKIEELVHKGCLNDFVKGNNYNRGDYRGGGRGGRKGSFRGGYVKGWGNNNKQPTGESEQRQ